MSEKFVIDLANLSWAIVDSEGNLLQSRRCEPVDLGTLAEGREVIALVPAVDVLLLTCKLPKMSQAKLRSAIPFALEDQLIDDIDALHFAFYQSRETLDTFVLVASHEKMDKWLTQLRELNIKPDKLLPVSLAMPNREKDQMIVLAKDHAIISVNEFQAFACESKDLSFYIESIPEPRSFYVRNYTSNPLTIPNKAEEIFSPPENYIGDLAGFASRVTHVNLLQGRYAKNTSSKAKYKLRKVIIAQAFACVLLLFLYPSVSYFILKSKSDVLNEQMAAEYHDIFPQSKSMVAPKMRIQEKLKELKSKGTEDKFLILMAHLAKALQRAQEIQLQNFHYQYHQLVVNVVAEKTADLTALSDYLTHQGLSVKQQNVQLTGNKINASLQIE